MDTFNSFSALATASNLKYAAGGTEVAPPEQRPEMTVSPQACSHNETGNTVVLERYGSFRALKNACERVEDIGVTE